jgi:membrane protein
VPFSPSAAGLDCLICWAPTFAHFASFNKTYGTLGAAVALMVWLYWTGFAMLVGAELNAELAKIGREGKLQEKQQPPAITQIDLAR